MLLKTVFIIGVFYGNVVVLRCCHIHARGCSLNPKCWGQ